MNLNKLQSYLGFRSLYHLWYCTRLTVLCALVSHLQTLPAVAADEWKMVFDPYRVVTLHLDMDPVDWDRVRLDQPIQNESWVPQVAEALLWGDGETPLRVSIRRKGESDIPLPEGDPQKVSLKIDINALVVGQKWHGLTKLSLENGSDNPLAEGFAWMAHRLAWEAGIYGYEAAYSGWVRLFINGELKGVFVNAEQRDAQFLRNHGYDKETGTWLYKVDGTSSLEVGTGNSPACEHLCYQPFNSGPGGGGSTGCTQPNLEVDLPQWIHIRGFFTLGAVDAFLENRDALFSHSGKNSYAVDFDPPFPRTRLYFPWDLDTTISTGEQSIYGTQLYQTQLLMHPWFGQVYEQLLRDLLDGPFSAGSLKAVIDRLEPAIGPAFDEDPYVYQGGSHAAFEELRQWVDRRVTNVRGQLTRPFIPGPQFNQPGGEVLAGFNVYMLAPTGGVYYTLDGTDPRAPGGAISSSAQSFTAPVVIDRTTHVIARAFDGQLWSALPASATFNIARYASALRFTEIMYHPASGGIVGDEDNYEFLELKNTGAVPLDLAGYFFDGISYTFAPGTIIPQHSFFVLVRDPISFSSRYPGVAVGGIYWGRLSDAGEKIRLRNSQGNTVLSAEYDDDPPWPLSPDGLGYSLVLADTEGDPDHAESWRASSQIHGSPGGDDPQSSYTHGVVINEVLSHSDPPFEDAIELCNTSSTPADISGWFLSDDFVRTNAANSYELKKYRVPAGTVIPAGGFKVFYENDFRTNNSDVPFALTEFGETVYLSSANANGDLTGLIAGATFGACDRGVSVGRYRTSIGVDFVPLARTTFGADAPADLAQFESGGGAANTLPRVGPVVINEIMYHPGPGASEFIELLSITNVPVDLAGWRLAGADFTFPTGTVLAGEGLLLLLKTNQTSVADFCSQYQVPASVPVFAADFVLENEGEALRLEKPNDTPGAPSVEVDRVRYNDKSPWPTEADGQGASLERFSPTSYGNDPINWRTVRPGGSPGRRNLFAEGMAISKNSSWKYHDLNSDLGTAWQSPDYSDSGWPGGDGILGYGAEGLHTLLCLGGGSAAKPITVYFRKEFVVNDPVSAISNLRLEALYDDGFVAYLNGAEILRSASMPAGSIGHGTLATQSHNSLGYEVFDLSGSIHLLQLGRNVFCAEVHQVESTSEDLLWDAALNYDVPTQPTVATPVVTPPGGIFSGPVQITIEAPSSEAELYYTLNGTAPDSSATRYSGPFIVESTTEVRTRAYQAGYNESEIVSALFSFPRPGLIEVGPSSGFSSSGPPGGIFNPCLKMYTITNAGDLPLEWAATTSQPWTSLAPADGLLSAGQTATVTVSINPKANMLPVGIYMDSVSFLNGAGGVISERPIQLTVAPVVISIALQQLSSGELQLTVVGLSQQRYSIQASDNLAAWTPILTNTATADPTLIVLPPGEGQVPKRFYRLRAPP